MKKDHKAKHYVLAVVLIVVAVLLDIQNIWLLPI